MVEISGAGNWRLTVRREAEGAEILQAHTCDRKAVLPDALFGLPVVALGDRALAPEDGRPAPEGETVRISCGTGGTDWENQQLEELSLPESLRRVGDYALLNCRCLKTLRLFDGVTAWGGGVLMNCRSLDTLHLTRTGNEQGPSLAYLVGELSGELEVIIQERSGENARLLFPEFVESYEENCPAHHFDYSISGAGYPYHHCFRQKKLRLKEYDALWPGFLGMDYEEDAALRLAWFRLRWPLDLGEKAERAYLDFVANRLGRLLKTIAAAGDAEGLHFLLSRTSPSREDLSGACAAAREHGASAALARLLEEQHRRFPVRDMKRFAL